MILTLSHKEKQTHFLYEWSTMLSYFCDVEWTDNLQPRGSGSKEAVGLSALSFWSGRRSLSGHCTDLSLLLWIPLEQLCASLAVSTESAWDPISASATLASLARPAVKVSSCLVLVNTLRRQLLPCSWKWLYLLYCTEIERHTTNKVGESEYGVLLNMSWLITPPPPSFQATHKPADTYIFHT